MRAKPGANKLVPSNGLSNEAEQLRLVHYLVGSQAMLGQVSANAVKITQATPAGRVVLGVPLMGPVWLHARVHTTDRIFTPVAHVT